jgi:hypothetical protein
MNSSGFLGGTGFLIIDVLAVILLGIALAYGTIRYRARGREKAIGDSKAAELAKRPDPDE